MDEPDKFMDDSYRKKLLEQLLTVFEQQPERQFILLTPLDYRAMFKELRTTEQIELLGLRTQVLKNPREEARAGTEA